MSKRRWTRAIGLLLAVAAVAVTVAVMPGASAATNPHTGSFTTTTDACAACHRTHTGEAARLLKRSSPLDLCFSCHDGTGADTNVVGGIYVGSTNGTTGAGLRGGGYSQALMNTGRLSSFDETGSAASTTSKHTVQATSATSWGAGPIGSNDAGDPISLDCTNCHNPHGNGQYRVLKRQPGQGYGTSDVTVLDEDPRQYTVTYDGNSYRETAYVPATISSWCAQCHTRYQSGSSASSGDTVFDHRHRTDVPGGCLSCHVAHGTAATMAGSSAGLSWPAGATATWQDTGEGDDSRLLQTDQRKLCNRCHDAGSGAGQYGTGDECAACHRPHTAPEDNLLITSVCTSCHGQPPSTGSHVSHFTSTYGPAISACETCHGFAHGTHIDGNVTFADGATSLAATTSCNTCHSPGGEFDGVTNATYGAKANWGSGVYSGGTLRAGLEDWCISCHDDAPPTIGAVAATNIRGDGSTYGYKVTGHGRNGLTTCEQCHDPTTSHIDGDARTYSAPADNYQAGYRLRYTMDVPLTGNGYAQAQFDLCFQCHTYSGFLNQNSPFITNYQKNDNNNYHRKHVREKTNIIWDSDWSDGGFDDGNSLDSRMTCTTCHNIHGSPQVAMIRDGSLVNRSPLMTFKWYTQPNLGGSETTVLADSQSAECSNFNCHGDKDYDRSPILSMGLTCAACHTAASDVDNFVYGDSTAAKIGSDEWATSGHDRTSGTYPATGNPAANFSGAASGGNTCLYCHDEGVAHDSATNPFRLANTGGGDGQNGACLACHKTGSSGYDPDGGGGMSSKNSTVKVGSNHYGSKHASGNNGGQFCWDCHDPHGDSNVAMVHDAVSSQTDGTYGVPSATVATTFAFTDTWGSYVNNTAYDGICQVCHTSTDRFTGATKYDAGHQPGSSCISCHQHDDGFGPSMSTGSHPTHTSSGVNYKSWFSLLACSDCHNVSSIPQFSDGQDLANTTACDSCHSPAAPYDGVSSSGGSVGAKDNWSTKVYDITYAVASGKERWCAGCHDASVGGKRDIVGSGFYTTGHGKAGTPAEECAACHDTTAADYPLKAAFTSSNFYSGSAATQLALCFTCHAYSRYHDGDGDNTFGEHRKHVDGENASCYACHAVAHTRDEPAATVLPNNIIKVGGTIWQTSGSFDGNGTCWANNIGGGCHGGNDEAY